MKLCYDCASIIESNVEICPFCGADTEAGIMPKEARHLTPGTYLDGDRYIIGRAIDSYESGIVYAAFDTRTQKRVAVTEYFPSKIATRVPGRSVVRIFRGKGNDAEYIEGLQRFVDRSEKLANTEAESGRDKVLACFQENDTAYTVSEPLGAGPTATKLRANTWIYYLLIGVVLLCALIAALILTGVISFGEPIEEEEYVPEASEEVLTVPDLIGLTEEQARELYPEWELVYAGTASDENLPIGCITEQDPESGAPAEPGTPVYITVNIGVTEEGAIPYMYGMGVDKAKELLEGYGVSIEYAYDDALPVGCVKESVPAFGEKAEPGQEVKLTVSRGGLLEGVSIDWNEETIGMIIGQGTLNLTCSILPYNIDLSKVNVEWACADPSVASADGGILTANAAGSTTVTVMVSMVNEDTGETVSVSDGRTLTVAAAGQTTSAPVPGNTTPKPTATPKPSNPTPKPPSYTHMPVATLPPNTPTPGATSSPETQAPETQAPETQAPATQAPATQAPETQPPETEAPVTPAPTEAPTQAPATEQPTSMPGQVTVGPILPTDKPTPTPSPIYTPPPADF